MSRTIGYVLALIVAVTVVCAPSAAAVSGAPYELNAILSLTGPAAFYGRAEQQAMTMIETITNKSGGINGRPLKITIVDDQSNPQFALQLANTIIAKNVPIFIGSDFTAPCAAIMPLVAQSGPTQYCTSPGINPPAGSYTFSASASTRTDAVALVRWARERGWKRIGLITSTDASGQAFDNGFDRAMAMPENAGMTTVDREHFATADLSIAGQAARLKAANPDVLMTWTTGTPFGTVLRGIHDVGYDGPVTAGNGNMAFAQLSQYTAFLPKQLYFPGRRALSETGTLPGPVRDAQAIYFKAFAAIGVKPDFASNIAWDPTMIVISALKQLGPGGTAQQYRDYILNLHGWVGINGIYDFRDGEQRGLGINAIVIDRYDPATVQFVAVSRPGGHVK